MASRFWVGGTGTWDASDTTHWSATTGGAGGQSVPGSSDTVTLDGSSGGGTVTVNTTVTVQSITMGAFTGTLDFATNNNNVTLSVAFTGSGTGARTLNMGNGTWTLTSAVGSPWDCTTVTSFTLVCNSSTILFSAVPSAQRTFIGGGLTYNDLTVTNAAASSRLVTITGSNTFNNVTMTNVRYLTIAAGATQTISGTLTYDGTSTSIGALLSSTGATTTLSVANANTLNYLTIDGVTKAGAGSITANNSYDSGNNSGVTINNPTTGTTGVIGG